MMNDLIFRFFRYNSDEDSFAGESIRRKRDLLSLGGDTPMTITLALTHEDLAMMNDLIFHFPCFGSDEHSIAGESIRRKRTLLYLESDTPTMIASVLTHSEGVGGFDPDPLTSPQMEDEKKHFLRNLRGGGFESQHGWRECTRITGPLMPREPDDDLDDRDGEGRYAVDGGTHSGGSSR